VRDRKERKEEEEEEGKKERKKRNCIWMRCYLSIQQYTSISGIDKIRIECYYTGFPRQD
jgi:hypothetical protein